MGYLGMGQYWYKAAFWSSVTVSLAAASVALLLLLRHGLLGEWLRRCGKKLRRCGKKLRRCGKRVLQLAVLALLLAAGVSLTARAQEDAPVIEIEMAETRSDEEGLRHFRADNAGLVVRIRLDPQQEEETGEALGEVAGEATDEAAGEESEEEAVSGKGLRSYHISVLGEKDSLEKSASGEDLQECYEVEWRAEPEDVAALGEGLVHVRVEAESGAGFSAVREEEFVLDLTAPEAVVTYQSGEAFFLYPEEKRAYCRGEVTVSLTVSGAEESPEAQGEAVLWTVFSEQTERTEELPEGESYRLETDGSVIFAVSGEDLAGNPVTVREVWDGETQFFEGGNQGSGDGSQASEGLYTLIRDTVSPVLYCTQSRLPVLPFSIDAERNAVYYSALPEAYADGKPSVAVRFAVEEANPDPGRIVLGYTFVPAGGEGRPAEEHLREPEVGAAPGQKLSLSLELVPGTQDAPDGIYRFLAEGTDRAGNPLCLAPQPETSGEELLLPMFPDGQTGGRFVSGEKIIDTKAPEGILTVTPSSEGGDLPYYRVQLGAEEARTDWEIFTPYRSETEASLRLETADASPVRIALKLQSTAEDGIFSLSVPESFENRCTAQAQLRGEQIFWAEEIVLTDRAGNWSVPLGRTAEICLDAGLPEVDLEAPSISVRAVPGITARAADGQPIYGGPVRILVYVNDRGEGSSSTGLRDVVYDLKADGEYLVQGRELFSVQDQMQPGFGPERIADGLVCSFSDTVIVPAEKETQTNDLELIVRARDRAGNNSDERRGGYFHFGIDTAVPEVAVWYDNNTAVNGHYFPSPRTAVIEVRERNLDPAKLLILAEGGIVSSWQWEEGEESSGDRDLWRCEVRFPSDGDCTLRVEGTDAAGNVALVAWEGAAPQAFTVDMTPPVIEAVFDRSDVRNGRFYNHPKDIYLRVRERNFDASLLRTSPSADGLSSEGDLHTAVCTFEEEGEFRLTASCTDLAGNEAVPWSSETFVIDMTPPLLEIGGAAPGTVNAGSGEWRPLVRMEDRWLAEAALPLLKRSGGQPDFPILWEEESEGQTVTMYRLRAFPETAAGDGIWVLSCSAQDLAGNRTERSARYCINRFGSDFLFSGEAAEAAGGGYLPAGSSAVVTEENVCPIVRRRITLYRDGTARILQEGVDYEVVLSRAGGKCRTDYVIDAACLDKQGNYELVIRTEDAAGNVNNSAAVRKLAFRIDTAAPVCRILGVDPERHIFRTSTLPVRVLCTDSAELTGVRILIRDSEEQITSERRFGGEEMPAEGIPVLIPAAEGMQTLTVEAWDGAGNTGKAEYQVLVQGTFREAGEEGKGAEDSVAGVRRLLVILLCMGVALLLPGYKRHGA